MDHLLLSKTELFQSKKIFYHKMNVLASLRGKLFRKSHEKSVFAELTPWRNCEKMKDKPNGETTRRSP